MYTLLVFNVFRTYLPRVSRSVGELASKMKENLQRSLGRIETEFVARNDFLG